MTSKDTDTVDAKVRAGNAAQELTAARAALASVNTTATQAEKAALLKRIARAEEAKAQADRRKTALGA